MSAKEPVIKFSPFEALFIGEKNKILKRQPMKNTIFVTRLNQRNQTINLRDLFDLEESSKSENSDVIFKMPQRVCDFLKDRKVQNRTKNFEKGEILCYEFEGCKMTDKNNETLKVKPSKSKFKRKFKYKDTIKSKVVKKFPNPPRKRSSYESKYKSLVLKSQKNNYNRKRHVLRGKDGKFICKTEYEKLKLKEISPTQKYLSNYLHQLYLKKNKQRFNYSESNLNGFSEEFEMPHSIETVIGLPNLQFDITAPETVLNEVSKKYYESYCHEDFQFPKLPNQLQELDFENDSYLIDIIYENFPERVKFDSHSWTGDFSDALVNNDILKPEMNVKMYEKKKNGFTKDEFREILGSRFPLIKLRRINSILPNDFPVKNEKESKYLNQTKIDEPYNEKSHLISGKRFGSLFFKSVEGKDIFIGNLMKPFLQNSWFGSLPES